MADESGDPASERAVSIQRLRLRLELATEATNIGVFDRVILTDAPTPPYWSPSMRALLGYDATAPADPDWFLERVVPRDRERMIAAIERSERPVGQEPVEVEVRWRRPDGSLRWMFVRSRTLFDDDGGPTRSLGIVMDVTERRQNQQRLLHQSAILDATPDIVAIVEASGEMEYLNGSGRARAGLEPGDPLIGLTLRDVFPGEAGEHLVVTGLPEAERHGVWVGVPTLDSAGDAESAEAPLSLVVLAHRLPDEPVSRYSVVARDLSRERELEAQLHRSRRLEAIGRLAGGVAHDFNNVLTVIMSCAELALADMSPDGPGRAEVGEIATAAARAANLTRQLLAVGRRQVLQPRPVDVNAMLHEAAPFLRRLVDDNVLIHAVPTEEPAVVHADPGQVEQILLNLVVNARDALVRDGGEIVLEVMNLHLDAGPATTQLEIEPGDYVVLAVSDNGNGMDEATKQRVFEPFFTTKPGTGTGLGLATVFGIVKQSGGAIWVYSELGHGTTFKVYLPRSGEPPVRDVAPVPVITHLDRGGVVLLADDDDQVRNALVAVLQRSGFEVLTAGSPRDVLLLSQAFHGEIALLLTDVVMPGISGRELAEGVRERHPDVPVLFMSGFTENSIVHHGVLEEGIAFIAKPVTPGRLLAAIQATLRSE